MMSTTLKRKDPTRTFGSFANEEGPLRKIYLVGACQSSGLSKKQIIGIDLFDIVQSINNLVDRMPVLGSLALGAARVYNRKAGYLAAQGEASRLQLHASHAFEKEATRKLKVEVHGQPSDTGPRVHSKPTTDVGLPKSDMDLQYDGCCALPTPTNESQVDFSQLWADAMKDVGNQDHVDLNVPGAIDEGALMFGGLSGSLDLLGSPHPPRLEDDTKPMSLDGHACIPLGNPLGAAGLQDPETEMAAQQQPRVQTRYKRRVDKAIVISALRMQHWQLNTAPLVVRRKLPRSRPQVSLVQMFHGPSTCVCLHPQLMAVWEEALPPRKRFKGDAHPDDQAEREPDLPPIEEQNPEPDITPVMDPFLQWCPPVRTTRPSPKGCFNVSQQPSTESQGSLSMEAGQQWIQRSLASLGSTTFEQLVSTTDSSRHSAASLLMWVLHGVGSGVLKARQPDPFKDIRIWAVSPP